MQILLLFAVIAFVECQVDVGPGVMTDTSSLSLEILEEARSISPWISSIRRRLHKHPEVMYELHNTSAYIREVLDSLNIKYQFPVAQVGIVAIIGTGESPVVGLRADMDGLPIQEMVESDYKSEIAGRMHACGHDGHVAMLLGAAKILKAREASIKGTIKLVFQPAEEGGAGALKMIHEGVLENPKVERMFGIHIWPYLQSGRLASRAGTMFAAAGMFEITVNGASGHAAIPGSFVDPIVTAAAMISSLQTIISRDLPHTDTGVFSITRIAAGDAFNIIPDKAVLWGTFRSLTHRGYHLIEERVQNIITHTAAAFRASVKYEAQVLTEDCLSHVIPAHFTSGCVFPPLINDPEMWKFAQKFASDIFDQVEETPQVMVGEDFAYYANRIPSCLFLLGSGNKEKNTTFSLHSSSFNIDEEVLPRGVAMHVLSALNSLTELSGKK